ncbi:penicillin-insensitive murein endopeptidase [Celeribacter sp.]|uniref:penicillin-insensitive murein endopeptidase n=1 Tax=Celeribacter sp. TaxID=1890673 RepID=UPI003A8F20AA
MRSVWFGLIVCAGLAACGGDRPSSSAKSTASVTVSSSDHRPAKAVFGAQSGPSSGASEALGSYAKGCVGGAVQLPETGPTWQAMRLSRNRNWGHETLVDFVKDLSRKAAAQPGWAGLYVGDMSQPRGGPMLSGHASHQIGLDVDVWMLPPKRLDLSRTERENLSSISMRRAGGAYVNSDWTQQHHNVIKAAAQDPRVARIFVFPGAKVQMCNDEKGDRAWLNKIRPWWGHHYHFHVRLKCPKGEKTCVDQAPPPAGDGCADAQSWVNNILNPPPPNPNAKPSKPKPQITMATLPAQCSSVASQH